MIGKYVLRPLAAKKIGALDQVIELAPAIKTIADGHPSVMEQLREMKHAVADNTQATRGVGARLKELEDRHDMQVKEQQAVNKDLSDRISNLEGKVDVYSKHYHIRT